MGPINKGGLVIDSDTIEEAHRGLRISIVGSDHMVKAKSGLKNALQFVNKQKTESIINQNDIDNFDNFTKQIYQKKIPKLPFSLMKHCLEEYNLIQRKKSKLTSSQRIRVKNIIHAEVRSGNIILKLK